MQPNGTLGPVTWGAPGWETDNAAGAQQAYDQLAGLSAKKAQAKIVELLVGGLRRLRLVEDLLHAQEGDRRCRAHWCGRA